MEPARLGFAVGLAHRQSAPLRLFPDKGQELKDQNLFAASLTRDRAGRVAQDVAQRLAGGKRIEGVDRFHPFGLKRAGRGDRITHAAIRWPIN